MPGYLVRAKRLETTHFSRFCILSRREHADEQSRVIKKFFSILVFPCKTCSYNLPHELCPQTPLSPTGTLRSSQQVVTATSGQHAGQNEALPTFLLQTCRSTCSVSLPLPFFFSKQPASVVSLPLRWKLVWEPREALIARLIEADGLPYLTLAARLLNQAGGPTEAGEGEGEVLAGEGVGVILAHFR